MSDTRPLFSSFDHAWGAFESGNDLTPMTEWRERLTAGRAQFLSFQAPLSELPVAEAIEEWMDELADIDGLRVFERHAAHLAPRRRIPGDLEEAP